MSRLLRAFGDVREGEAATALLLALNVFLILTAYYFIKPVREALILSEGGAEVKSYAAAAMALLLLVAVPAYGWLASRLPRRPLINTVTLFFIACLGVFFALTRAGIRVGVPFFLWVGIFNLMIIAQFWSFANDVYDPDEGKRLFPLVAFGGSAGGVLGAFLTGRLIKPLGVHQLLLVAAALLVLSLLVTNVVDRRERDRLRSRQAGAVRVVEAPVGGRSPFALVLSNRYLLLIALLILVLNLVNTTGEYILGRTVSHAARQAVADGTAGGLTEAGLIGKFYADIFGVVNLAGLVLQLFFVSRILKYLGVRAALLFLPVIALGGYAIIAFWPVLTAVRWAKTAENATDYSLQNTVRNVLFLPTTREEKYKAKQAIDSFFVRAGDVLSAALVYAGTTWLALQTGQFALVNVGFVLVWIGLALAIGREFRKREAIRTGPR